MANVQASNATYLERQKKDVRNAQQKRVEYQIPVEHVQPVNVTSCTNRDNTNSVPSNPWQHHSTS